MAVIAGFSCKNRVSATSLTHSKIQIGYKGENPDGGGDAKDICDIILDILNVKGEIFKCIGENTEPGYTMISYIIYIPPPPPSLPPHTTTTAGNHSHNISYSGVHSHTINGGDSETRPNNIALNYIIKVLI